MPQFYNATGQMVDAATATLPNGRCKPGYHAVLADGEAFNASTLMMRDHAAPAPTKNGGSDGGRMVRDAIRDSRHLPAAPPVTAPSGRPSAMADAAVRDFIRTARFR